MKIMASDTSTKSLSVAIIDENKLLFSHTENTGNTHSQRHMLLMEKALKTTKLTYSDIDLFACTVGPGSYTGIRINVASLKTIAHFSQKGVIGVSTLNALAYPFQKPNTIICPVIDARQRRVFSYVGLDKKRISDEGNFILDEVYERIIITIRLSIANKILVDEIIFCGNGAKKVSEDLEFEKFAEKCKSLIKNINIKFYTTDPKGEDVAALAYKKYKEGQTSDPFQLQARYISPSQAERAKKMVNSSDRLLIRPANSNDIDEIEVLEKETSMTPWSRESLLIDLKEETRVQYLTVLSENFIVGYIGIHFGVDEAQIINLAVSKNNRREGYGKLLLKEACLASSKKGYKKILLEVREGNIGAISLYISNGFQSIGVRKNYYKDNGETAIIMQKTL